MTYLTISMTGIVVGVMLFIWGIDRIDDRAIYAGAIIIGIAILMWLGGLRLAIREQKEQKKRWEYLFALIEAIAMKMGVDITSIRERRGNGKKVKSKDMY